MAVGGHRKQCKRLKAEKEATEAAAAAELDRLSLGGAGSSSGAGASGSGSRRSAARRGGGRGAGTQGGDAAAGGATGRVGPPCSSGWGIQIWELD